MPNLTKHTGAANADARFVEYYSEASLSAATIDRFTTVKRKVLALRQRLGAPTESIAVADIGCGAGTQSMLWAKETKLSTKFFVGTALDLPFDDGSFDVVLVPEILEHLPEWKPCLDEAVRVLRPGGVLYLSTTNVLCPSQQEFSLPLYSWYPAALKRHCEKLAVTTHGHWVEHTTFPAVHWFSFYELRDYLSARGVSCYDRFDMINEPSSRIGQTVLRQVRRWAPLRLLGHAATPYTVVFGVKRNRADA
jgi:ubiquinone/menaquinone biosynthesis C-methylase UbiE